MSTLALGSCVGFAYVKGNTGRATVFDTDEDDWFILITPSGARFRRRRDQIQWRK